MTTTAPADVLVVDPALTAAVDPAVASPVDPSAATQAGSSGSGQAGSTQNGLAIDVTSSSSTVVAVDHSTDSSTNLVNYSPVDSSTTTTTSNSTSNSTTFVDQSSSSLTMVNNTHYTSTTNNYCALPAIDPVTGLPRVNHPVGQQQLVAGRTISFGSSLSFGRNRAERIRNFSAMAGDRIGLAREIFSSIGSIENLRFRVVSGSKGMRAAARTDVNIIYNQRTGGLYYNQNLGGSGFGQAGGMFAVLLGKPELSSSNFIIS